MKRLTALLLLCALFLSGCADTLKEPVTFYYLNSSYEEDMSAPIGSEQRESSGHREDLTYLLALYLMGPAAEELQTPLPAGTRLLSAERSGSRITVTLSDCADTLSDARFTLACGCLALTCLEITEAKTITINSGERSLTLEADNLLLQDLVTAGTEYVQ